MDTRQQIEGYAELVSADSWLRKEYAEEEKAGPESYYKMHLKLLEGSGLHDYYEKVDGTLDALKVIKTTESAEDSMVHYLMGEIDWVQFRDGIQSWFLGLLSMIEQKKGAVC